MQRFVTFLREKWLELLFLFFAVLFTATSYFLGYTHTLTQAFLILFAYTMGGGTVRSVYEGDIRRLRQDNKTLFDALERRKEFVEDLVNLNAEKNRGIMNLHMENQALLREIDILRNPEAEEEAIEAEIRRINS